MKKTAIATTALLAVTLFSTVAPAAHAATLPDTTGDVNFTKSTDPNGELQLTQAPSVDFGDQTISGSDAHYDQSVVTGVQVVDNRGSNAGWHLSVSNTQFMGLTTTTAELTGAKLTLTSGAVTNKNGDKYAATAAPSMILNGDGATGAVDVMHTIKGETTGMGINDLAVTKASLDVPGATAKLKEKYESTITWTLADAGL